MDYLAFASVTFSGVFLSLKIVNGFLRMFKHFKDINKFEYANFFLYKRRFFIEFFQGYTFHGGDNRGALPVFQCIGFIKWVIPFVIADL